MTDLSKVIENGTLDDFNDSIADSSETRGAYGSLAKWFDAPLITQNEIFLRNMWAKKGIIRTYVELPVDEALKGGIQIKSDNLDEDAHNHLEECFLKYLPTIKEAFYWARLYGGAGLITLNNGLPLSDPFVKANKKNKDIDFMAIDRWRLGAKQGYKEKDINLLYGKNSVMYFQGRDTTTFGTKIDNSRIQIINGDNAPLLTRQELNGWGLSVVEKISASFDSYETANNLIFQLLKEGKTNIIKVRDLVESLASGKFDDIVKAVIKSNNLKKQINTMVMDSQDDFMQTQSNLSGFDTLLAQLRQNLAADLRIPMTKLFGISASGFNSGEDDIDNFNSMIESDIRPELRPVIQNVIEVLAVSELGVDVQGLKFSFAPLKELPQTDLEVVNTSKYERYISLLDRGLMSEEDFKQKCIKEGLM